MDTRERALANLRRLLGLPEDLTDDEVLDRAEREFGPLQPRPWTPKKAFVEAWTADQDARFDTVEEAVDWLCQVTARGGEGWYLYHPHEEGVMCACSQYLTDHHPQVVDGEEVD